jgi:hypothetical protein
MNLTVSRPANRNWAGLSVVALLHLVLIHALLSGRASKMVYVLKPPIDAKLIEEIKS